MPRFASSTTPIAANATWNSGILSPDLADKIVGSVFADQAGTIYIEQSSDGSNWDIATNYAVTASTGRGFSEEILLPYLRVRFVNGASAQSVFRISARVSSSGPR